MSLILAVPLTEANGDFSRWPELRLDAMAALGIRIKLRKVKFTRDRVALYFIEIGQQQEDREPYARAAVIYRPRRGVQPGE